MNSTQDYFRRALNISSPTLIEQVAQLIEENPITPSNPIPFTDRPLNNQEASFSPLNPSTPSPTSASPPPNVPPPQPSVSSNHSTFPAESESPYDQITTLLRTLKKLLHIDFDLRERQTAYNKKRQYKVFSQVRRKTRAICQMMRSKEAALSTAQLAQLAHSVCLLRMKDFAVHAQSTLSELSRIAARLHKERHESTLRASQAAADNTTTQGNTHSDREIRHRVTMEPSPRQGISHFIMPV